MTFFRYRGLSNQLWGMSQMERAKKPLRRLPGLEFFKLLGTGAGGGYSLYPQFSVYGLLAIWENEAAAGGLFSSEIFQAFRTHSTEQFTVWQRPYSARGVWSRVAPFQLQPRDPQNPLISVLTRATLRLGYVVPFWKQVPAISRQHHESEGLVFTQGVGEIPVLEQATYSIWENEEAMMKFAYKSRNHQTGIAKTRKESGFKEEMFSRFQPYRSFGVWDGANPLAPYNSVEVVDKYP